MIFALERKARRIAVFGALVVTVGLLSTAHAIANGFLWTAGAQAATSLVAGGCLARVVYYWRALRRQRGKGHHA